MYQVTMLQQNGDDLENRTTATDHLADALAAAEDPTAKYHIREAYQKLLVRTDEVERSG